MLDQLTSPEALNQAVSAAADAFQRQTSGLSLLEELRNACARHPHRRGEVFTGMEGAVGKLAQERESERSEHLHTPFMLHRPM